MNKSKTCFVACPIGEEGSDIRRWSDLTFKYVLKPVVEKYGYSLIRADHINSPGMITIQIIEQLLETDLVIADLTDNNPNVLYELAIRHLTSKPYIQMMKIGQKIPFDISGMRTIFFNTDLEQAENAKLEISKQIEFIEKGDFKAINPITLARNYSAIQNVLKDENQNSKEEKINKTILNAINILTLSLDDIKKDIYVNKKYISETPIPTDELSTLMNERKRVVKELSDLFDQYCYYKNNQSQQIGTEKHEDWELKITNIKEELEFYNRTKEKIDNNIDQILRKSR